MKSERYNVSTEQVNKIALSSHDDKRMKSADSIETYAFGTRKDLVSEKEEINFNSATKEKIKDHSPSWLQNPDCPYRIVGHFRSGKMMMMMMNQTFMKCIISK